jgi:hypothetical protein
MTTEEHRGFSNLVTVGEYPTALEAQWARAVLASAGICCQIPDDSMATILPFTGLIRAQVPAEKADEASALLESMDFERGLFLDASFGRDGEGGCEEVPSDFSPVEALDPHDLCPSPEAVPCPQCGSEETEPSPAPDYAAQSALASFFQRLAGRGWMRCAACGRLFERGRRGRPD